MLAFVFLAALSIASAQLTCNGFSGTSCKACTAVASGFGSNCRWCPGDQSCHAYGSVFECSAPVTDPGQCLKGCATPPCGTVDTAKCGETGNKCCDCDSVCDGKTKDLKGCQDAYGGFCPTDTCKAEPTGAPTEAPTTKGQTDAPTKTRTDAPTKKAVPTAAPTTGAPTTHAPTVNGTTYAPTTAPTTTGAPTSKKQKQKKKKKKEENDSHATAYVLVGIGSVAAVAGVYFFFCVKKPDRRFSEPLLNGHA
jgi:hypothetical protein